MGLLIVAAAAALGVGCTDANYSVYILRNQAITDGCKIPAGGGTDLTRGVGQLDVTAPIPGSNLANIGYLLAAAVVNGTTASMDLPNSHIFFAQGADVTLRSNGTSASNAIIAALQTRNLVKRTQYFSGSIPPGGTAGMGITLIDEDQTAALANFLDENPVEVIATAKIFGQIDGTNVTGGAYDFPIDVCQGCLVNNLGTCASLNASTMLHTGGTCNPLQDALLDCCTNDAGKTVCPPVVPPAPK
jgi:hypothetical protein